MNVQKKFWGLGLALAIAGCGKAGSLEPRAGQSLPPQAYGQSTTQTSEALLKPTAQARPSRSDELLRRSERRTDNAFDLPPGNNGQAGQTEGTKKTEEKPVSEVAPTIAPKTSL
jgi:hypothetical protein